MKTLLKIEASIHGAQGQSTQLVEEFARRWLGRHPGGRVLTRDLAADPAPHLTAEGFQAFLSAPQDRSPEQQEVVDYSDALIEELRVADVIVLGVPMYNFSVPSTLRAYFDHIARAGVTFRYTPDGPEGLVTGKKAYLLVTRGGVYGGDAETQVPYVKQFLAFLGITDVEIVRAQGLAIDEQTRDRSLAAARDAVAALVPQAIAA